MNPLNELMNIYSQATVYIRLYHGLNLVLTSALFLLLLIKGEKFLFISGIYSLFRFGQLFCLFALVYLFAEFSFLANDFLFLFKISLFANLILFVVWLWKASACFWRHYHDRNRTTRSEN